MEKEKQSITLTYEIPKSVEGNVFGPPTWFALHDIVSNIPCEGCKNEAVDFINFFHDLKNYQLGKQIKYKKNFIYWINRISSLKNKPLILK